MQKKMSPGPWEIQELAGGHAFAINCKDGTPIGIIGDSHLSKDGGGYLSGNEILANTEAIVSAVNGTYGCGINPEAVKDMLFALEIALSHFDNKPGHHSPLSVSQAETIRAAINKAKI
jgi:hypothetical protein